MTEATATAPPGDRDSRVDGAVDALRRSVLAIKDTPELVVVFVVVAPLAALLGSIERGATTNSAGVRILLALLAAFVAGVAVVVGLLLLVLPGLYLSVRFYLVVPAVMLGDDGPLEALGSSWNRTDGNVFTVAGVALGIFAVSAVVQLVLLFALTGGVSPTVELVRTTEFKIAQAGGTLVSGPLGAAAMAVLYDGLLE